MSDRENHQRDRLVTLRRKKQGYFSRSVGLEPRTNAWLARQSGALPIEPCHLLLEKKENMYMYLSIYGTWWGAWQWSYKRGFIVITRLIRCNKSRLVMARSQKAGKILAQRRRHRSTFEPVLCLSLPFDTPESEQNRGQEKIFTSRIIYHRTPGTRYIKPVLV